MELFLYYDLKKQEDTHFWHIAKRKLVSDLIKKSGLKNPKILDIGCGTGKTLEDFNKLGKGFGIDISKEAIRFCKSRGLKRIKLCSGSKTSFKNSQFQIVTLLDVLEHVKEKSILKEIKRILSHDGLLIVSVPAYQWLWSQWDKIAHHKRRYTKNTLKNNLEKNGFKVSYISYVYSFLLLPIILIRGLKSMTNKKYPSDFDLSNKFINNLMLFLFKIERILLGSKTPFGTSIICVAKKIA